MKVHELNVMPFVLFYRDFEKDYQRIRLDAVRFVLLFT